ncbi:hypothetical protein [Lentzea flava]|uniref:hypothetical protein n=1 Tax=Lentzea flava TaxID=103732 RepID=UPI0027DF14CA|nr:hypothetical protein [Lentzea flava]
MVHACLSPRGRLDGQYLAMFVPASEVGEVSVESAIQLPNDARAARFTGAAPPAGHCPHRYFIVVHALDFAFLGVPADRHPGIPRVRHVLAHPRSRGPDRRCGNAAGGRRRRTDRGLPIHRLPPAPSSRS